MTTVEFVNDESYKMLLDQVCLVMIHSPRWWTIAFVMHHVRHSYYTLNCFTGKKHRSAWKLCC